MGSEGIGACTIVSQVRQLSLGRTWRVTLKLEGTYSSTSRSSCPMRLNRLPPHPGQVVALILMLPHELEGNSQLRGPEIVHH